MPRERHRRKQRPLNTRLASFARRKPHKKGEETRLRRRTEADATNNRSKPHATWYEINDNAGQMSRVARIKTADSRRLRDGWSPRKGIVSGKFESAN